MTNQLVHGSTAKTIPSIVETTNTIDVHSWIFSSGKDPFDCLEKLRPYQLTRSGPKSRTGSRCLELTELLKCHGASLPHARRRSEDGRLPRVDTDHWQVLRHRLFQTDPLLL